MNNAMNLYPVILCGGSGTRLWPLSRKSYPKQFTSLTGETSLFQASVLRCEGSDYEAPIIITNSEFRFIVVEQMAEAGVEPGPVLIEPEGRNTAPAILAAALSLEQSDPEALMLVMPSDHVIPDTQAFRAAVRAGIPEAQSGKFVTFGICPDRAETGYGYLELEAAATPGDSSPRPLVRFVEKPDSAQAEAMIEAGNFLWNAGIFLFSVRDLLAAFEMHAPGLIPPVRTAVQEARADLGFLRLAPDAWAGAEDISIDYAIMEKAANLSVVPYHGHWSDLGDWQALWREGAASDTGTVTEGQVTAIDCSNSLLRAEEDDLELVGVGLENIVAVAMRDAVLVADMSRSQDVRQVVTRLKARGAKQATQLPIDYRPWGWFESLVIGDRFQVKRIVVHPGAALSLQSHHHRSEHWIVVQGTARVTIDDEVQLVTENQSVYIPVGGVHRMENPGKLDMVLIEVQTGSYLGEDDIIRYEDVYARQ